MKEKIVEENKKKKKLSYLKWLKSPKILITIIACLIMFITSRTLNPVRIAGQSMQPTLRSGEVYSTSKDTENIKNNDLVVFAVNTDENGKDVFIDTENKHDFNNFSPRKKENKDLTKFYIKRVVASPGDTVLIKDGFLYINKKKASYKFDKIDDAGLAQKEIKLKEDEFFCMGDNVNHSKDSRMLGPVPRKTMMGKLKKRIL